MYGSFDSMIIWNDESDKNWDDFEVPMMLKIVSGIDFIALLGTLMTCLLCFVTDVWA